MNSQRQQKMVKTMKNRTSREKIIVRMTYSVLFLIGLILITTFSMNFVSAWFPGYSWNETSKTATICDWDFGLGLCLDKIMDVQLVENTQRCVIECYSVLKITPEQNVNTEITFDFKDMFNQNAEEFVDEFKTYEKIYETEEIVVDDLGTCNSTTWNSNISNYEYLEYGCVIGNHTENKAIETWNETNFEGISFVNETYIKLVAKKEREKSIDWIPSFLIAGQNLQVSKMAWWNSSLFYRRSITFENPTTSSLQIPYVINGSEGLDGNIIWTLPQESFASATNYTEYLYYNSWSEIYVLNTSENQILAKETEQGTSGNYSESSIWGTMGEKAVWHLSSSQDISGNNRDISWQNIPVNYTTGKFGKAIGLDGSQYGIVSHHSDFDSSSFSISFWIKPAVASTTWIIDKGTGVNSWQVYFSAGRRIGLELSPSYVESTEQLTLGTWYFVVATYDGTNIAVSINGGTPATATGSRTSNVADVYIGATGSGGAQFTGTLDELRFYDNVLSQNEIIDLYQQRTILGSENNFGEIQTFLTSPANNDVSLNSQQNFSCYAQGTSLIIFDNITLYVWDYYSNLVYKNTKTASSNYTAQSWIVDLPYDSTYYWNCYAIDTTALNSAWALNNRTFIFKVLNVTSQEYNTQTFETSEETYVINFEKNADTTFVPSFIYDDALYNSDFTIISQGNNYTYSKTLLVPIAVIDAQAKQFHWSFATNYNGTLQTINSSTQSQIVNQIKLKPCNGTYNITSLNFFTFDELTNLPLDTTFSGNFKIWKTSSAMKKTETFSLTNNTNHSFCIYPDFANLRYDAEIVYDATDYYSRTFSASNNSATNVSNEINLYLIDETEGIKFYVSVLKGFDIIDNAIVYISKYMPSESAYRQVAVDLTDGAGEFTEYFELDKDFNFIIVKDGSVVGSKILTSTCASSPCTMTIQLEEEGVNPFERYNELYAKNILYNLSYNPFSKMVQYTYLDLDGIAQQGRLEVDVINYNQSMRICDVTNAGISGTLVCNLTTYTQGDFVARGYISKSPEKLVATLFGVLQAFWQMFAQGGKEGILFSMFIFVTIALIGSWNPAVGIAFGVVGLFAINFLRLMPFGLSTLIMIAILATILIIKMKT